MIQVERVDSIRVAVTDIEKAKHFDGELLGLSRNPHLDHEPDPASPLLQAV